MIGLAAVTTLGPGPTVQFDRVVSRVGFQVRAGVSGSALLETSLPQSASTKHWWPVSAATTWSTAGRTLNVALTVPVSSLRVRVTVLGSTSSTGVTVFVAA